MTGICPLFKDCIAIDFFAKMLKQAKEKPEVYNQIVRSLGIKFCKDGENCDNHDHSAQ